MNDGITASLLLKSKDQEMVKLYRYFLEDCRRRGVEPTKRQAKKWLAKNNMQAVQKAA